MGLFLSKKIYHLMSGILAHWCPGCNERHFVYIEEENCKPGPKWSFNEDYNYPTFTPSVLHESNVARNIGEMTNPVLYTKCHYFIRNGMIEFCPDSLHRLAGQVVPLPDFPNYETSKE